MKRTRRILAFLIALIMVLSFIPFNVFGAPSEEEKANLVEIQFGNSNNITQNGNTATITYDNGTVTVTATNLDIDKNENWDYGNGTGTMCLAYTTDTEVTFTTAPNENYNDFIFIGGQPQEIENHSYIVSDLSLGSEVRLDFDFNYNGGGNNGESRNFTIDFHEASYNVEDTIVTPSVEGAIDYRNVVVEETTLITLTNFDSSTMEAVVSDGNDNGWSVRLIANENNQVSLANRDSDGGIPNGVLHFDVHAKGNNNGGNGENLPQPNNPANTSATLNYKVTGDIEYDEEMGTGVGFAINGTTYDIDWQKAQFTEGISYERDENGQLILDENNEPIPVKDPETFEPMNKKMGVTITGDTIEYYNDTETNKVSFVFVTAWDNVIESIKINGQIINNLPQTREELITHYTHQAMEISVDDIDNSEVWNIEVVARRANKNELYMGNFLWDYNPKGYTGPEDKILNASLIFVEAEYNGHKYKTVEEINSLGGLYNWHNATRKKKYTDNREGVGSATFPTGTKLTVKIIPDAGYQLVDFGINGGKFDPQEEIGTYTFEIQGGNFHLQATIAQVEDVVKTKSEKIESGTITLGGEENSMAVGTARLDVNDIELNKEQISNFEEAAEGYDIKDYVDISLYNTVFKGKESESWDTQVKDLKNDATITLKLEEGVNGNEVVIVHEKHDGTYEIIPVTYDPETNTITFKTKSFSNYAIATKKETNNIEVKKDNVQLSFEGEGESKDYSLTITNLLDLTDDELKEMGITRAQYNELYDKVKENTKEHGTLLLFYDITVNDKDGKAVEKGKFSIKLPLTEELKKYNSFKLLYINDEMKAEDVVELKVEGDYLVGTLPHLSAYALVGEVVEETSTSSPKTGDNIILYVSIFAVATVLGGVMVIRRKNNTKKKVQH